MPLDSMPISLAGCRLATITIFRPTSSSGVYLVAMPATMVRSSSPVKTVIFISFFDFDSVDDAGIQLSAPRINPIVFLVSMRDLFTEAYYGGLRRWNFLRLHHQFIMANSRRARYDFFMMICGPLPVATWARDDWTAPMSFDANAARVQPQIGGDHA